MIKPECGSTVDQVQCLIRFPNSWRDGIQHNRTIAVKPFSYSVCLSFFLKEDRVLYCIVVTPIHSIQSVEGTNHPLGIVCVHTPNKIDLPLKYVDVDFKEVPNP